MVGPFMTFTGAGRMYIPDPVIGLIVTSAKGTWNVPVPLALVAVTEMKGSENVAIEEEEAVATHPAIAAQTSAFLEMVDANIVISLFRVAKEPYEGPRTDGRRICQTPTEPTGGGEQQGYHPNRAASWRLVQELGQFHTHWCLRQYRWATV